MDQSSLADIRAQTGRTDQRFLVFRAAARSPRRSVASAASAPARPTLRTFVLGLAVSAEEMFDVIENVLRQIVKASGTSETVAKTKKSRPLPTVSRAYPTNDRAGAFD